MEFSSETQKVYQGKKVDKTARLFYGLSMLGLSTLSGVFLSLLTMFYQDYFGISARWITIAFIVYAVWNAINDPIFGQLTDSTRSKHGRRIPFMRYTAPFFALTFIVVWFVPEESSPVTKFIWMLVSMILYDSCFTIIGLVHSALMPEMTESLEERSKLQVISSLFGLLGTLFGFIIPDLVRPKAGSEGTSLWPLRLAMIGLAVVCGLLIWIATYKIKERPEFSQVDKPIPLKEALKATLTNKNFIIFDIANFMAVFMFSICMGALFYVSDYVTQSNSMYLLAALFIPLAISVLLTKYPLKRFDAVVTFQLYMVITGIGLLLAAFLPANWIYLGMGIVGFGYAGILVCLNLALGLIIDDDEVRTGVRREGSYFGANALITKPAESISAPLTAAILSATGFITRESMGGEIFLNQPTSAIWGIRMIVGLIPGIAMLIGAGVLFFFPLKGKKLKKMKAQVLAMHAEKEAQLAELQDQDPAAFDIAMDSEEDCDEIIS